MQERRLYNYPHVNRLFMNDMEYYYSSLIQRGFALEGPYIKKISQYKKVVYIIECREGFGSKLHICGYEEKRFLRRKIKIIPQEERDAVKSKLLDEYNGILNAEFWNAEDAERGELNI